MKTTFLLLLLTFLAACTPAPLVRPAPATIDVVHNYYVPIPDAKTAHGTVPKPANKSEDELINVAKERAHALLGCFIQLDNIHAIQGQPVPDGTR